MLPIDIENDNTKSLYVLYDSNDLIVEKWSRKPHPDDIKGKYVKGEILTPPEFYGEWCQATQEEINALNKDILSKKPRAIQQVLNNLHNPQSAKQPRPAKKLSDREKFEAKNRQELEAMIKLLQDKYDEMQKQKEDKTV